MGLWSWVQDEKKWEPVAISVPCSLCSFVFLLTCQDPPIQKQALLLEEKPSDIQEAECWGRKEAPPTATAPPYGLSVVLYLLVTPPAS